ncbi:MAG: nucleoside phosphorylase [Chitinophagales bacterium]
MSNKLQDSELILNNDGSVYHIHLKEEHIADTVILVGDQGRVKAVSDYFEKIEYQISNREFVTCTGYYKDKRLTVLSTGIGADNIDIAVSELDAAVNIDLKTRHLKSKRRSLNLVRIGTSGALQPDIPVGSFVISEYGLGFEGLVYYYDFEFSENEQKLTDSIQAHLQWNTKLSDPYVVTASEKLFQKLGEGMVSGITATASGFYGPQGRSLYLQPSISNLRQKLSSFSYNGHRITNFEMETSALYGLGKMMGHHCCTCCAIIANRSIKQYADDYHPIVKDLIKVVLDRLAA